MLEEMAQASGKSIREIVGKLVEKHQRAAMFAQFNEDYARIRNDPIAWAEELAERALWERTLMDGIDDESPQGNHPV